MRGNILKLVSLVLSGLAFVGSGYVDGEARTGLLVVAGMLAGAPIPSAPIRAAGKSTLVGLVLLASVLGGCAGASDVFNRATLDASLGAARHECDRMEGVIIHEGDDEETVQRRIQTVRSGCDFAYHLLREAFDHAGLAD